MDPIQKTQEWVKQQLHDEPTGHDWQHIRRVTKQAQEICQVEGADHLTVSLAALLHDLVDDKVVTSEEAGVKQVTSWLKLLQIPQAQQQHILTIITSISFKGGNNMPVESLEAKVVQDADRLDAIGAIGIARTFMYAGNKGHKMYDPLLKPRTSMTFEEYRHGDSSAIGHFYEKLLKLQALMNTKEGKRRAQERHEFMKEFLNRFIIEWEQ